MSTAVVHGRRYSVQSLERFGEWLERERSRDMQAEEGMPEVLRMATETEQTEEVDEETSYAENPLGAPETPLEVLEFYSRNGFLPTLATCQAEERTALIQFYGLDEHSSIDSLNDVCDLTRAFFTSDVSVFVVTASDKETFLKGFSPLDGDETDWANLIKDIPVSFCMSRMSLLALDGQPVVIPDASKDWRYSKNPLFAQVGIQFFAAARIALPIPGSDNSARISIGSLVVASRTPQVELTSSQLSVIQMLAKRVEREIVFDLEERQRARVRRQSAFLSSFFRLTLGNYVDDTVTKLSPAMKAVTTTSERNSAAFALAAEKVVELSTARTSAILDLRAFWPARAASAGKQGDSERQRRADRPSVYYDTANQDGMSRTVEGGSPVHIIGSHGLPDEALASLDNLSSENIDLFEELVRRIKEGNVNDIDLTKTILASLIPPDALAVNLVPIFSHDNSLAVLLVVSLDVQLGNSDDLDFLNNMGYAILSSLLKDQDAENDRANLSFVSTISHALRTPVGALSCQLELLRGSSPETDLQIEVADACVSDLVRIIDDSVDYLTMCERPISSASSPDLVHLPTLLRDCTVAALNRSLQVSYGDDYGDRKPVEVILEISERVEGWFARVAAADLQRIVGNLVANSFAYSDQGVVRVVLHGDVSVVAGQSVISIEVVDEGRGIPSSFIETGQLFVPFRRAEAFTARAGLGLPIVSSLVSAHGGKITVNSTVGKGTSVKIALPLTLVSSQPAPFFRRMVSADLVPLSRTFAGERAPTLPLPESQVVRIPSPLFPSGSPSSTMPSPDSDSSTPAHSSPAHSSPPSTASSTPEEAPPSPTIPGRRVRCFVVEDNIVSRNLLGSLIKKKGWEFLSAADGEKGVELFRDSGFRPDITVMDIGLPRLDGIGASHEIRRIEKERGWSRHKIIAFTALSSDEDKKRALGSEGPIDDWMLKGGSSLRDLTAELASLQLKLDQEATAAASQPLTGSDDGPPAPSPALPHPLTPPACLGSPSLGGGPLPAIKFPPNDLDTPPEETSPASPDLVLYA